MPFLLHSYVKKNEVIFSSVVTEMVLFLSAFYKGIYKGKLFCSMPVVSIVTLNKILSMGF